MAVGLCDDFGHSTDELVERLPKDSAAERHQYYAQPLWYWQSRVLPGSFTSRSASARAERPGASGLNVRLTVAVQRWIYGHEKPGELVRTGLFTYIPTIMAQDQHEFCRRDPK